MGLLLLLPSSSLDALETIEHLDTRMDAAYLLPAECPNTHDAGVHDRHQKGRSTIIRALKDTEDVRLLKRAGRLCECASWPHIRKRADGTPSLCLARCKDRLCPLCSKMRGRECSTKVATVIRRMNAPRFLTLTVRNGNGDLGAQVTRLAECFKDFRRRESWKQHVRGGVYSIEVTFNTKDQTWHPHVHIVYDGQWWQQSHIAKEWLAVTSDSKIVHVAAVHDAERTGRYIAAYVNTPPDIHTWPPDRIREYAIAMHGRRVIHTFGTAHGRVVDADLKDEPTEGTKHVCAVSALQAAARRGNPHAQRACDMMTRMGGFWSYVTTPTLFSPPTETGPLSLDAQREFVSLCERACAEPDTLHPGEAHAHAEHHDPPPYLIDVTPRSGAMSVPT